MRRAARAYFLLAGAHLRGQLQYRVSFFLQAGAAFMALFAEFGAILILFGTFRELAGWSVGDVALLYGLVSIAFGLTDMFGQGFEHVSQLVKSGEFDRLLIRPISPFLQVLASEVQLRRLGRIASGAVAVALATRWVEIAWTPLQVATALGAVLSTALVFLTVWVISAALCFWTVEQPEVQNVFSYGGVEVASYPVHIYERAIRFVFLFLVPLGLTTYYPALTILGKPDPLGLPGAIGFLAPGVAALFFAAGLGLWRLGLRHYQGTGS